MKIIKSTHRHKMNKEYSIIIDYNKSVKDRLEFNDARRALIRIMGPKITYPAGYDDLSDDWTPNPRWFWEENSRYDRRRIYLKSEKELAWLQLAE